MAPDTIKIEVSRNLIKELYDLAGIEVPESIDNQELIRLIKAIKLSTEIQSQKTAGRVQEKEEKPSSILVVDDLGLVVYQLSLLLTKSGYNVMLARSAPEAFTIFEERGPFDYVLTDLFMPNKEDGTKLITDIKALIKEKKLDTKVVVMSSTKDLDAIEEVMNLGADSFLEKGQNWKTDLLGILNEI